MFSEDDDGTADGNREHRPYSTLLVACVLATGKLGARFVAHAARRIIVMKGHRSHFDAVYARGLQGNAS